MSGGVRHFLCLSRLDSLPAEAHHCLGVTVQSCREQKKDSSPSVHCNRTTHVAGDMRLGLGNVDQAPTRAYKNRFFIKEYDN